MSAVASSGPSAPRLGAAAIRRAPRRLLAVIVALLTLATVTHHLLPEHDGMLGAGGAPAPTGALHGGAATHEPAHHATASPSSSAAHGDAAASPAGHQHHDEAPAPRSEHAMPVMVACLGIVGAGFLLAYVGAVIRVRRSRPRRPAAARAGRRSTRLPGRAACRDGPPIFLRLQVLRA